MTNCPHENVQFIGIFSIMGSYVCQDCGETIDPVIYHRMKGHPHIDAKGCGNAECDLHAVHDTCQERKYEECDLRLPIPSESP